MLAAVKCKQNVDPALADALDGAVAEMSKMWLDAEMSFALWCKKTALLQVHEVNAVRCSDANLSV